MIIKFFATGTNAPRAAKDYLESSKDYEMLYGNAELTTQLAESLGFKYKYTSGVMALSPGEHLSYTQEQELIADFTKTIGAGLSEEPSIYIVKHTDKDRDEYHFVIANVDLSTGKSFTPYYHKLDKQLIDSFTTLQNFKYELTDPKSPSVKKHTADLSAFSPSNKQEAELQAHEFTNKAYLMGLAKNRGELINLMKDNGYTITRQTPNSISIKYGNGSLRLKGAFYEQDYQVIAGNGLREQVQADTRRYASDSDRRYTKADEQYKQRLTERTQRNATKYNSRDIEFETRSQTASQRVKERESQDLHGVVSDIHNTELGSNSSDGSVHIPEDKYKHRHSNNKNTVANTATISQPVPNIRGWSDTLHTAPVVIECNFKGKKIGEVLDSGDTLTAQNFNSVNASAFNIVRQAKAKGWKNIEFSGSDEFIKQAYTHAISYGLTPVAKDEKQQKLLDAVNAKVAKQLVEESRTKQDGKASDWLQSRDKQLYDFKTKINLADYLESEGYTLDKKQSSSSYKVLRYGSEKVIVHKASNGHYIYSDNNGSGGTIIDFVKSRKGLDLQGVRSELSMYEPSLKLNSNKRVELREHNTFIKATEHSAELIKQKTAQLTAPNSTALVYINKRGLSANDYDFKVDEKGNLAFSYIDRTGAVCGYELKNSGFTGQAKGGIKGLFVVNPDNYFKEIVVCESAIDAISKQKLDAMSQKEKGRLYVATGGAFSDDVLTHINALAEEHDAKVVSAFDRDEAGKKLTKQLEPEKIETPHLKDWNEQLVKTIEYEREDRKQERKQERGGYSLSM